MCRWKLVRYHDGDEFLYDLEAAPGKTRNRAEDFELHGELTRLRTALTDWPPPEP